MRLTPFAIGHTDPSEPREQVQVIKGLPSDRMTFTRRIVRVLTGTGPRETAEEVLRRHALENAGNGRRQA